MTRLLLLELGQCADSSGDILSLLFSVVSRVCRSYCAVSEPVSVILSGFKMFSCEQDTEEVSKTYSGNKWKQAVCTAVVFHSFNETSDINRPIIVL